MWIDTHAHLYDLSDKDLSKLTDESEENSVRFIVSTATSIANGSKVLKHCAFSPLFYGAIGISPFDTESLEDGWETELSSLISNDKIIAVGEIGLDSTNPLYPPLEKQIPFFEKQLHISSKSNKPAIIHSRGIEKETADICKSAGTKHAVFHCFTGDYDSAKMILDAGYYISFSGIITFRNAQIRSLVPMLPIDRILIETDTPYLSPVPFRGRINTPLYIRYIGEEIARILKADQEYLQSVLEKNFFNCFNIVK